MTLEEKAEKYARKTKKVDWEGFNVEEVIAWCELLEFIECRI